MKYAQALQAAKRELILGYLRETDWNVSAAARLAGVNRTWFYDLMEKLGLRRPAPMHHRYIARVQ